VRDFGLFKEQQDVVGAVPAPLDMPDLRRPEAKLAKRLEHESLPVGFGVLSISEEQMERPTGDPDRTCQEAREIPGRSAKVRKGVNVADADQKSDN